MSDSARERAAPNIDQVLAWRRKAKEYDALVGRVDVLEAERDEAVAWKRVTQAEAERVRETARDEVTELRGPVDALTKAAKEVLHEYDLWAEDANDGEFAIWSRDRFMAAFVHLRRALAAVGDEPAKETQ